MAENPYVNKVELADGTPLMDISDTTAEPGDVLTGKEFYQASGARGVGTLSDFTGATASTAGAHGLVPAPAAGDEAMFLRGDGQWANGGRPMVILDYGSSTWNDFITAFNANVIVYCRASSNSNPATGSKGRMAFMAFVNYDGSGNPTNVEFQYYRSVSSHSASQQGDQVFIYKLTNANAWSVTTREAMSKIAVGNGLTSSYSSGTITIGLDGGSNNASKVKEMYVGTNASSQTVLYIKTVDNTVREIVFDA